MEDMDKLMRDAMQLVVAQALESDLSELTDQDKVDVLLVLTARIAVELGLIRQLLSGPSVN